MYSFVLVLAMRAVEVADATAPIHLSTAEVREKTLLRMQGDL